LFASDHISIAPASLHSAIMPVGCRHFCLGGRRLAGGWIRLKWSGQGVRHAGEKGRGQRRNGRGLPSSKCRPGRRRDVKRRPRMIWQSAVSRRRISLGSRWCVGSGQVGQPAAERARGKGSSVSVVWFLRRPAGGRWLEAESDL